MAWNPIVPTARFGKQWSRNRRMQNYATSQEAAATPVTGASIWTDYRDITAMPSITSIADPTAAGEFASLGINTTSGGTWAFSTVSTNNILNAGSWVSTLTLTGAGAFVLLTSTKYSGNFHWAVVAGNAVT